MEFAELEAAVQEHAAIRRRQRLQPAAGPGSLIFPPTYPGEGRNDPPRHVFERRRMDGREIVCVLIDSVQSQANRMEEALLQAARDGRLTLPRVEVDFSGEELEFPVGRISVLEAPHRIFDAIVRDSEMNGTPFPKSELGKRLLGASPADATAVLEISPSSLLFGAWNSTGVTGGLGAKFTRVIASEIIGVGVPVEEIGDARAGEVRLQTAARRVGSRIDPLGIPRAVEIFCNGRDWSIGDQPPDKNWKKVRPSEINHGNIAPTIMPLGVTCEFALQTVVLSLAGLRRLRFGSTDAHRGSERTDAARTLIAALGLVAILEADRAGYALRSRCDLVPEGRAPLELVRPDGSTEQVDIDAESASTLYSEAFARAKKHGFVLHETPIVLKPQKRLVELVRRSQEAAKTGKVDDEED